MYIFYGILGALTLFFAFHMTMHVRKKYKVVELIDKYQNDMENPQLVDEIWEYISNDWRLGRIVKKHNGTREDVDKFLHKMLTWGNFRKFNRLVPIDSFFAAATLKYMFEHRDQDDHAFTMRMLNFFNI